MRRTEPHEVHRKKVDDKMTTLEALELDLAELHEAGALRKSTSAVQEAIRRLAQIIDSRDVEPRDKAAALKEMRAALESITSQTTGAQYASWLDRVSA